MLIIKQIENYTGYYVTSEGGVWSTRRGKVKVLSNFINRDGYAVATLCLGKKQKHMVHRLVALAFLTNKANRRTVNHINGNKLDNRLENLEWCTHRENSQHAYALGLYSGVGQQHYKTTLTEQDVFKIRYKHSHFSNSQLAQIYNVTPGAIYNIRKKLTWKHL